MIFYDRILKIFRLPSFTYLMCSHLALWTLVRLKAFIERSLDGLHFSRNGLEGFLIMLLPLQSFIKTFLFLADLCEEGRNGKVRMKVKMFSGEEWFTRFVFSEFRTLF